MHGRKSRKCEASANGDVVSGMSWMHFASEQQTDQIHFRRWYSDVQKVDFYNMDWPGSNKDLRKSHFNCL